MNLRLEGVSFGYGEGPDLIRGLDLSLGPGELLGVIGPNGAGKSTLVGLASGALTPRQGEIFLEGRALPAWRPRERARAMALVPQDPPLASPFTVEQTVLMGRSPHLGFLALEGPADLAAAEAAMEATDTAHLAPRPLSQLSGGERQRVLIARALAQGAHTLLCDEPTAHLDLRHQVAVLDLLRAHCQAEGHAALVVLHDLNLASAWCDRLLLLDKGAPRALGPPSEVLSYGLITEVYQTEVWVGVNALSGATFMVPVGARGQDRAGDESGRQEGSEGI